MKLKPHLKFGFLYLRVLLGLVLCIAGLALTVFAFQKATQYNDRTASPQRDLPTLRDDPQQEGADLNDLEQFWNDRLTYPTGKFDPAWLRQAAVEHAQLAKGVPAGVFSTPEGDAPGLDTENFTALGPQPEHMTGCSGCFDYGTTEGRLNDIVVDPTTTTNGSIVAYAASVGGGVWKTTNCCSSTTNWTAVTDDPLISTITVDTLVIDPTDHNTIYAGTGDHNFGSFSMGSQGILKSSNAGATWTVLGADVFGPNYTEPPGQFPQYNAVGKVRVDPNNRNNVVAGTKKGLYLSRDAGVSWTQCATNSFSTQRQDITGLELSNMGGGVTRIVAAVGTRGFPTPVQYDLGLNGANGIYSANMTATGCPTFTSIAKNSNGFVFGTAVSGSPYATGANMNAGSGVPCNYPITGGTATYCGGSAPPDGGANNLGRIDIAVAPSNPSVIYAQVGSIDWNTSGGCGSTTGCQLGVWSTNNGGASWTFMTGSSGASLASCAASGGGSNGPGTGDYPQNWYDQGVEVDPNNPDRVFIDTFDVWLANRTGTAFYDVTCGYSGPSPKPVHVDQHAMAFVPGSSKILLLGNDGGAHATTNADAAVLNTTRPTWFNMDPGLNTIEFYSGDISGNFATSATPSAVGGAQDNGPSSVTFDGSPTGPVQWQTGLGGDGFSGQIDPVGTGTSLRYWQGNNSGGISRCVSNCTAPFASWVSKKGGWSSDIQSFILPINLFHGGIAGGDDCPPAGTPGGCGHLIAGTTRVWETVTGDAATTTTWYVTNNPTTQNLTKNTLGTRSFITQVKYSPKFQSVAIVGTNDGNVQIGFNLGTGTQAQGNWVNVTGNNAILPNRPVLGIALDPSVSAANVPVGYAGVGGFNANTPTTPGHLFQVTCTNTCGSFTWLNKTGNLPDIPVDSVIVNPKSATQVFAGTDWGVYYTDDITAASPTWTRFENGLPHAMVWDMSIDRGSTTLSVWTRSRGAYVWPLPSAALQLNGVVSRKTHGAAGTFDVNLPTDGSGVECRSGGRNGNYTMVFTFANNMVSCGSPSSGSVSLGPDPNQCTAEVSSVPNQQYFTLTLTNAKDSTGATGSASGTMGVLLGSTTGDGTVNSADIRETKSQLGHPVSESNFRNDVNVDGNIDGADLKQVKQQRGTSLPQ